MPEYIQAERETLRQELEHAQAMRTLERQKAENEVEHQRQMYRLQEADFQKSAEIKQKLVYSGGMVAIFITGALIFLVFLRLIIVQTVESLRKVSVPSQIHYNPSQEEKRRLIQAARERERQYRLQMLRERAQRLYQIGEDDHRNLPQPFIDGKRQGLSRESTDRDDLPTVV